MKNSLSSQTGRPTDTLYQYRILIAGILGLMVAMGIGRFAYTPILPLMQRDLGMSHSLAGWLAGLNYLGYLAGAVLCSFLPRLLKYPLFTGSALTISIAATVYMGLTVNAGHWGALRFMSGVTSAILFIFISAEVGDDLRRRGISHVTGYLYSGVGLGIAMTGLLVPHFDRYGNWSGAWLGIGTAAAGLAAAAVLAAQIKNFRKEPGTAPLHGPAHAPGSVVPLAAAYFFEGLGYVVSATFLVTIIASTPGLEHFAPYSWVAVGLTAAPSTLIWPHMAKKTGYRTALSTAYALQASGILVTAFFTSPVLLLFAAISFGGTFMGIVAMTLTEGQRRLPSDSRWIAAVLTAAFGIGQVLGPIVAGQLADMSGDFTLPLILAAGAVMVSFTATVKDRHFID